MIYEWLKNKKPIDQILKRRTDGEFEIVYGKGLDICYLNATASLILKYCDGRHTVEDIKNIFLDKFDIGEEEVINDLITSIREFQWKKLVVLEG